MLAADQAVPAFVLSPPMNTISRLSLVVLTILGGSCRESAPEHSSDRAIASDRIMQFELASLEGGTVRPAELADQLVLIDFWATWCGPCHLQADILAKIYPELKQKGVEFLAVSLGEPEAVVRTFVSKRPFQYPVLVDPEDRLAPEYGIFILPTVVLLDGAGTVLYMHEGISTAERLRSAVDEILEGTRPAGRL